MIKITSVNKRCNESIYDCLIKLVNGCKECKLIVPLIADRIFGDCTIFFDILIILRSTIQLFSLMFSSTAERGVMNIILGASIKGYDYYPATRGTLKECLNRCMETKACEAVEYKHSNKKCDIANVTHFDFTLKPSRHYWNFYEINGCKYLFQKQLYISLKQQNTSVLLF